MTDTEILDYLQNDYVTHRCYPRDVQFGRVTLTLGLKPGTLREFLVAAIERDQQRTIDDVTRKLVGPLPKTGVVVDLGDGDFTTFDRL